MKRTREDSAAGKGNQTNREASDAADNGENRDIEIDDTDNDDDSSEHDSDDEDSEDSFGVNGDFVFDLRKSQIRLAKLSCFMGRPIGFDEYFMEYSKGLNPAFTLDHSQYNKDILDVYKKEKSKAKAALASLGSRICLSVDTFWSCEDHSYNHYLQLSAHFVDDKWKLKKWVIKFCPDSGIVDEPVLNALKDWEIEGKVFSFTMEGAHHDCDLVQIFKSCVEEKKKLPLDGKLFGVDCCARILDLMAEDAYEEISCITSKVQELISWKFPPVWYMPAYKLKEALEMESRGGFSTERTGDDYDLPSVEEWEKARSISNLVISVYEIVKTLFETKYPTANNFLHKLQEVRAMLFQEAASVDNFKSKVAKKMLERLDNYWDEMSLTLAIASVMDPRFKMRYFDYLSSKGEISGNKLETSIILDAIRSLYGDYAVQDMERDYPASDYSSSSDSEDESLRTAVDEERSDSVQMQEYVQFIGSMNQSPKSDLDRYLEDPLVSWSQDFNVLSWWRVKSCKYPTLSKMARDILAIPMSVATSFAAYYKDREAPSRISSSGNVEIKNALMCAPTWAKKPLK